jgi:hypothetical protein
MKVALAQIVFQYLEWGRFSRQYSRREKYACGDVFRVKTGRHDPQNWLYFLFAAWFFPRRDLNQLRLQQFSSLR